MARKYLDPEKVVMVIVGDRKTIEKGVRELKLGPVEVLSIEDVLEKVPKVEAMKSSSVTTLSSARYVSTCFQKFSKPCRCIVNGQL